LLQVLAWGVDNGLQVAALSRALRALPDDTLSNPAARAAAYSAAGVDNHATLDRRAHRSEQLRRTVAVRPPIRCGVCGKQMFDCICDEPTSPSPLSQPAN
jgi:hypothetical protein